MIYLLEQVFRQSIQALNWVEKYGGVVTKYSDPKTNEVYPIVAYNSDPLCSETDPYTPITPDDAFKSVVYWEQAGATRIDSSERRFVTGTAIMRFVAWINPKKQGVTPVYGLSSIYANDFVSRVNSVQGATVSSIPVTLSVTRASITEVDENAIFGDYSYAGKKYLFVQPFEFFAVDFEFTFVVPKNCASMITITDPIDC
jgi:hypothetical protein